MPARLSLHGTLTTASLVKLLRKRDEIATRKTTLKHQVQLQKIDTTEEPMIELYQPGAKAQNQPGSTYRVQVNGMMASHGVLRFFVD